MRAACTPGAKRRDLLRRNEHPGQRHEAPPLGYETLPHLPLQEKDLQGRKALDIGADGPS